jgi:iron complex transport system ATP-binding protein
MVTVQRDLISRKDIEKGDLCVELVSCIAGYSGNAVVRASARFCRGLSCIVGPNGSGKTTLLKTIAKILSPIKGVILIGRRDISTYNINEFAKLVGIHLPQIPILPLYKARDVVMLGRTPFIGLTSSKEDLEAVEFAMKIAKVSHLSERYFNLLSDGEKRRVMIAMAIARRPRILVLDEPTSFLDPFNRYLIFEVLSEIAKEIPVILSTHEVDLAIRFCDKIYYIDRGELKEMADPKELGKIYGEGSMILNPFTYSLEPIVGKEPPQIHIIGGCGSGLAYIRRNRLRNMISLGPLYPNDLDALVLKELGAIVITTSLQSYFDRSLELVKSSTQVIVSRVPRYCRPPDAEILIDEAVKLGKDVDYFDFNI